MNRTDRLLGIVLELQGRERRRAEDLARTFGVSSRTIYRDIRTLNEAGVPIVSAPNYGYSLMEGYFLPPVSFSGDEATVLLLGAEVMQQSFDQGYRDAAVGAARKIEAVLRPEFRKEVAYLRANIQFIVLANSPGERLPDHLPGVRGAIIEQRRLRFTYFRRSAGGGTSEREVDPHALYHYGGRWLLSAYCHLRGAMRTFRLDRMESVQILDSGFERQPAEVLAQVGRVSERTLPVRVRFPAEQSRWVRENPSFYATSLAEDEQGRLVVDLLVRHYDEVLPWLLSWGSRMEVLEPEEVREIIAGEGRGMVGRHR